MSLFKIILVTSHCPMSHVLLTRVKTAAVGRGVEGLQTSDGRQMQREGASLVADMEPPRSRI